jgi:integrase
VARQKLTAGRIRDFKHPKRGQAFLWDSEVPGLGVRATTGAKVFIYQARLDAKTIRVKIGDVRTWTIDNGDPEKPGARQEARRLQAMVDKGIDPRIAKQERIEKQKKNRQEAKRKQITLDEVWSIYIEARRPKWSDRHYADHLAVADPGGRKWKYGKKKIKSGPLASLMDLKLSELTQDRIRRWATIEAKERGARTRLAFSLLRAFVNWCEDQPEYKGLCPAGACSNRIKRDVLPKQQPKTDCLQKEQLPAWFKAVCEYHNPTISAYLQTLLLTGARREELAELKWDDVDFKWQSLTIHDKVEGQRTIPLSPYVASLLSILQRRNEWVFSSPAAKSGRIQEPRHAHNKAMVKAGIEGLTIHGLRRSFGTLSEWVECPVGVVAQIQGHKPSAIAEKHYRQRPLDLLRKWHVKIEEWILEQAGIEQPEVGDTRTKVVEGSK